MMKLSYMPPQIKMHHHVVMPIIMAASGDPEPPKKIAVSNDTVGDDEEYWFRAKRYNVWDDSEAFNK